MRPRIAAEERKTEKRLQSWLVFSEEMKRNRYIGRTQLEKEADCGYIVGDLLNIEGGGVV